MSVQNGAWDWVRRTAGLIAFGYVLIENPENLPVWIPILITALLFGPDVLGYQFTVNRKRNDESN
jgi:hypothetical protein